MVQSVSGHLATTYNSPLNPLTTHPEFTNDRRHGKRGHGRASPPHGRAGRKPGPQGPRHSGHRADGHRRDRRKARRHEGIARQRAGRRGRRADSRAVQSRQPRGEEGADAGRRRQPQGRRGNDRHHRRPLLGRKRGADSRHRPRREGGRGNGPPRRRVQAADEPLQLSRAEGGGAQAAGRGPARDGAGDRHRSHGHRGGARSSPNMPTCCKSARATCRTIGCSKPSGRPRSPCC